MVVVRTLAAAMSAALILTIAAPAKGDSYQPIHWRVTGSWAAKSETSNGPLSTNSPFARLFDRSGGDSSYNPAYRINGNSSPTPTPIPISTPTPSPSPTPPPSYSSSSRPASINLIQPPSSDNRAEYDAFINFGDGPYRGADVLTSGSPGVWYDSPVVRRFYDGGAPTAEQQSAFISDVISQVANAYEKSGIPVDLTLDPNASASHSLSVVSNANFPSGPKAVGIAALGHYGFTFVDKFGPVQTLDQLETAIAHNVAHELMHTFGVDHLDKTGKYLDSAITSWDVLSDPNAQFGPDAIRELLTKDFKTTGLARMSEMSGSEVDGQYVAEMNVTPIPVPVPEPSSLIAWGVLTLVGAWTLSSRRR